MIKKAQSFSVLFFVLLILLFIPYPFRAQGDESEAVLKVSQAEDSLNSAYLSVLEAERAGGDVNELIRILNTAVEQYSQAERAIETEEYDLAVLIAERVVKASNLVLDEDIGLIVVARNIKGAAFRNQLYMALGESIVIITLGFLGWRRFKDHYIQMVKSSKPEMVIDEP